MRRSPPLVVLALALAFVAIAFAQDRPGVKVFPVCATVTHAHQASDYRLALIRVETVTQCGFTYEDLQENVVSAEPVVIAGCDGFPPAALLTSVVTEKKRISVRMLCVAPVKNAFGILLYCNHCRAGFLLQVAPEVK